MSEEKIKVFAKALCVIGIGLSVIFAIIMFSKVAHVGYNEEETYSQLGAFYLIVGPIVSVILSFLMYGFGELIETNSEIAYNTRENVIKKIISETCTTSNSKTCTTSNTVQEHTFRGDCEICGKQNVLLRAVKIGDKMGTDYRNVCSECAKKCDCAVDEKRELDELLLNGLITKEEYEEKGGKSK